MSIAYKETLNYTIKEMQKILMKLFNYTVPSASFFYIGTKGIKILIVNTDGFEKQVYSISLE